MPDENGNSVQANERRRERERERGEKEEASKDTEEGERGGDESTMEQAKERETERRRDRRNSTIKGEKHEGFTALGCFLSSNTTSDRFRLVKSQVDRDRSRESQQKSD
jgi:hypothetical protein